MRGAGRMGIAARLRERLLRGRGRFLRAKDLQGEASRVPDNGVKEQTRNLMEEAGGAEEATCALREADGVVRAKTRNLTEAAGGAEESGGALRGVDKGAGGPAGSAPVGGEAPKALQESGGREYDEAGVRAYLLEHGEVLERLAAELRQGAEGGDAPALLGRGARVVTRTPSDRPRTIADAGEMAEQYFRRTHI